MKKQTKPWVKTYNSIIGRCGYKKSRYYKNNIKCLITKEELKFLWFQDKAYLMKKPSIDRKDNKGNYELNNCRYIEFSENARQGNLGRKTTSKQMKSALKNIQVSNKNNLYYRRKVSNGVKVFNSITEAARYFNIGISSIVNCCKGTSKSCRGLRWKYVS